MTDLIERRELTEGVLSRRVWAWLIDLALIAAIVAVLYVLMFVLGIVTFGLGFSLMALLPAVPLAYHALFVASSRAATPGQSLLGIAVATDPALGRPSLFEAALFTGGLWLTFAVFMPLLLVACFTERRRALHDIVAGVVVVRQDALTRVRQDASARVRMEALTQKPAFANTNAEMPTP